MKNSLLSIGITLSLLLALGILTAVHGRNASESFTEQTKTITAMVQSEDYAGALDKLAAMRERWERESPLLQTFVQHTDADAINVGLRCLETSLAQGEQFHALLFLDELSEDFGHLRHRDSPTLKNIL